MKHSESPPIKTGRSVAIIGGGVAGLASATLLSTSEMDVHLFEAHRSLGGRAGSFFDAPTGTWIDHCQHVTMGCCTHFADFCRRTHTAHLFRRQATLHFFAPDGKPVVLRPAPLLPAPLHLAPFLARLRYLSWRERRSLGTALLRLARVRHDESAREPTIGQWLTDQRQTDKANGRFWAPVLVSALGETLDRISLTAARQVFVDGFLAHRNAYEVILPAVPLSELYDHHIADFLSAHQVQLHRQSPVTRVESQHDGRLQLTLIDGSRRTFDQVIVAVAWHQIVRLLSPEIAQAIPELARAAQMPSAPITSLHLWFDRPITPLPHAVLVERLAQWVFAGPHPAATAGEAAHYYYQVVISASHALDGRQRDEVLQTILAELAAIWPETARAQLVRWRLLTRRRAVFSMVPGLAAVRPDQQTPVANLLLAGDWTRTGWPATMEGAVRSGYAAARHVLLAAQLPAPAAIAELRPSWLFRLLGGGKKRSA